VAQELWQQLGHSEDLTQVPWPSFDPELAKEEEVEIIVQINGRLRSKIIARQDMSTDELKEIALGDPRIAFIISRQDILKTIVVPNKLVNIVVAESSKAAPTR
jgi:leucyl-tRNA synthetase